MFFSFSNNHTKKNCSRFETVYIKDILFFLQSGSLYYSCYIYKYHEKAKRPSIEASSLSLF